MTTIPKPTAPNSSFSAKYDAWNRLVSLDNGSTASFQYDGLSRRTKRSGGATRHFYYNYGWQVVSERATESGNPTKQFVWGSLYVDELVLRDHDADASSGNGLESRHYATHDALFSTTVIVDSSGTVDERFAYTPYGESTVLDAAMVSKSGTSFDWEHRFTGRRLDPQSGLQLNRHRYLNPSVGSWINRDPMSFSAGDVNLSRYVGNHVGRRLDPTGLFDGFGNFPFTNFPILITNPNAPEDLAYQMLVQPVVTFQHESETVWNNTHHLPPWQ